MRKKGSLTTLRPLLAAALLAGALAGCGSSSSKAGDDPVPDQAANSGGGPQPAASTASRRGPQLKIVDSRYGRILSDRRGRALYLFTADSGRGSACYGDCATAWPPYIVRSKPKAGAGVKAGRIGTSRRSDGRLQATYAGHPVYYYVGDDEPGEVLCQAVNEFGGYWYVLRSSGKAVR